jgi:hypothetical protein
LILAQSFGKRKRRLRGRDQAPAPSGGDILSRPGFAALHRLNETTGKLPRKCV